MTINRTVFYDSIKSVTLPDRIGELATEYERLIGIRDDFVWGWMYSLLPSFRLSCVPNTRGSIVREQKTALTLFITILDDIAEHDGDKATFEQARNIPFPYQTVDTQRPDVDGATLEFATRVWQAFEEPLRSAPHHEEFIDVLRYDVRQTINAMDYSWLLGTNPAVANISDTYRYDTHNMVMFPFADVDLMYSPGFDDSDLPVLRETLWDLQQLARIGNWLTTWERELEEGDYSSGLVVAALQDGIIDPGDLDEDPSPEEIDRYVETLEDHDMEGRFREEWKECFADLRNRTSAMESVDVDALIEGMQTVFEYHQNSQGLK